MGLDESLIGTELPPVTMILEPGRLRLFAKATGQTDPLYSDDQAATVAGHPGLLVPPTYLFAIELEQPNPFAWLTDAGIDLRHVLHGEQAFIYHQLAHAGDKLVARPSITDVYDKKGGALRFLVKHTAVTRDHGELVAELETVTVVRTPAGGDA